MRVLVVDDEQQIVRALRVALSAHGYEVAGAGDGQRAVELLAGGRFDAVVLDLGLPGMDGVEVIKRVRGFSTVPILVLSVRETQHDKVSALDAGADDYLTKPFGMDELLARLRALLRRAPGGEAPAALLFGDIEVDLAKRLVKRDGSAVHLTPTEFELLEAFVTHPGKLLMHGWLLGRVWGGGGDAQVLRVYVAQLRRKLEQDPSQPRWLLTEAGLGYRWAEPS